jgi:hypothetical protein
VVSNNDNRPTATDEIAFPARCDDTPASRSFTQSTGKANSIPDTSSDAATSVEGAHVEPVNGGMY